jgi:hypothetical protein
MVTGCLDWRSDLEANRVKNRHPVYRYAPSYAVEFHHRRLNVSGRDLSTLGGRRLERVQPRPPPVLRGFEPGQRTSLCFVFRQKPNVCNCRQIAHDFRDRAQFISAWTAKIPPLGAVLLKGVVVLTVEPLVPDFCERQPNFQERLQPSCDLPLGGLQILPLAHRERERRSVNLDGKGIVGGHGLTRMRRAGRRTASALTSRVLMSCRIGAADPDVPPWAALRNHQLDGTIAPRPVGQENRGVGQLAAGYRYFVTTWNTGSPSSRYFAIAMW